MVAAIRPVPANQGEAHSPDELEAEIKQLRQVLVHLTRLSAIGTTAAMLVHELAQPVTAASNYLAATQRLLADKKYQSHTRAQEAVELAQACLARAADLMGSVKEAAAGKAYRPRAVDLRVIIDDVLRLYGGWKCPVKVEIAPAAARIMGDRIQLGQVVSNLIRNAAEATEGQALRSVRLSAILNDDNMVEVRVKDNGPGLLPHLTENLFSPFISTKAGGLGVGLSICRAIIEQHKGSIWAESLPIGTVFCFTLLPA